VIYVTVIALAVVAVTVLAAFAALRWQARQHTREQQAWAAERASMIATMAHLADRPLPERGWNREPEPAADLADLLRERPFADPESLLIP
jgi:hypothetical protein